MVMVMIVAYLHSNQDGNSKFVSKKEMDKEFIGGFELGSRKRAERARNLDQRSVRSANLEDATKESWSEQK